MAATLVHTPSILNNASDEQHRRHGRDKPGHDGVGGFRDVRMR
jgi:hypothetical protein